MTHALSCLLVASTTVMQEVGPDALIRQFITCSAILSSTLCMFAYEQRLTVPPPMSLQTPPQRPPPTPPPKELTTPFWALGASVTAPQKQRMPCLFVRHLIYMSPIMGLDFIQSHTYMYVPISMYIYACTFTHVHTAQPRMKSC